MPIYNVHFRDDSALPIREHRIDKIACVGPLDAAVTMMATEAAKDYTLNQEPLDIGKSITTYRAGSAEGRRATISVIDQAKSPPAPVMAKAILTTIPAGFRAPTAEEKNLYNGVAVPLKAEMTFQLAAPPNIDMHQKAGTVLQTFMTEYGFHDRDTGDFIVLERVAGKTGETTARPEDEPATQPAADHW